MSMGMKLPPDVMAKIDAMVASGEATEGKPAATPPSSHGIIIHGWHPAKLNELLGVHWGKAARLKKADRDIVAAYSRYFPKASRKRRVRLRIVLKPRQRAGDPDAYWKSLLDALVACGQLVDDTRKWCEPMPVTFDRADKMRTEIILEDMEG